MLWMLATSCAPMSKAVMGPAHGPLQAPSHPPDGAAGALLPAGGAAIRFDSFVRRRASVETEEAVRVVSVLDRERAFRLPLRRRIPAERSSRHARRQL